MAGEIHASDRPGRLRRRPLVDEVRDHLARDFIMSGTAEEGRQLPSEKELCDRYGVSRVTLRASMRGLQEAGLITSRHGVGWMTVPNAGALMQGLDRLSSLETFARESGQAVTTEDLEIERIQADEEIAARLEVPQGHPVLALRRVKVLAGTRVAWQLDFVPEGPLPFETLEREFAGSVLDVLLSHPELGVEYGDTELHVVNLSDDIAARLRVPPGAAALALDTIVRGSEDRAVEWAQAWLLPEHFRLRIRRRRQIG